MRCERNYCSRNQRFDQQFQPSFQVEIAPVKINPVATAQGTVPQAVASRILFDRLYPSLWRDISFNLNQRLPSKTIHKTRHIKGGNDRRAPRFNREKTLKAP